MQKWCWKGDLTGSLPCRTRLPQWAGKARQEAAGHREVHECLGMLCLCSSFPTCPHDGHSCLRGEAQLLDLLLAQLSMRAQEAGRFDTLFPVLQAIHRRLSVSSTGESNISGASLRNLDKMISKMSCQQMILFAKKNPNVDSGIMQLVMDQLTGSCPTAPFDLSGSSVWL